MTAFLPTKPRQWSLPVKISGVLFSVLIPVFLSILILFNQTIGPGLHDELTQWALSVGKGLAQDVRPDLNSENKVESRIREVTYMQPNIIRIDVFRFEDPDVPANAWTRVGSSVEESIPYFSEGLSGFKNNDETARVFSGSDSSAVDIYVPICSSKSHVCKGVVYLKVSTEIIDRSLGLLSRYFLIGAFVGFILLYGLLWISLKKTMESDRKLVLAEAMNQDLSERLHSAEREMINLEKLAVLGQLTATFAHEMGSPLQSITGHITLLKEGLERLSAKQMERFEIVESQLAKISSVIRELLRSTSKPKQLPQKIDPLLTIHKVLQILEPRMRHTLVRIEQNELGLWSPIYFIPYEFEQICMNLLVNAMDSMEEKKVHGPLSPDEIVLSSAAEQRDGVNYFILKISDTGKGIPEELLTKVFDPFVTTKAPEKGTGLGLSICMEILKRIGGDIRISSVLELGTEVKVYIPESTA